MSNLLSYCQPIILKNYALLLANTTKFTIFHTVIFITNKLRHIVPLCQNITVPHVPIHPIFPTCCWLSIVSSNVIVPTCANLSNVSYLHVQCAVVLCYQHFTQHEKKCNVPNCSWIFLSVFCFYVICLLNCSVRHKILDLISWLMLSIFASSDMHFHCFYVFCYRVRCPLTLTLKLWFKHFSFLFLFASRRLL